MIALGAPVDLYCERFDPGLFAEPWNAISNVGFIAMGFWLMTSLPRRTAPRTPGWTLEVLAGQMLLIGICSTAFHLFAVEWAQILDVAAIALFISFFAVCFAHDVLEIGWSLAWMAAPVLWGFGVIVTGPFPKGAFNGSVAYFPALAALIVMAVGLAVRRRPGSRHFAVATLVFSVSLWLRSMDLVWCPRWPWGTHWAWHLLNALVLAMAVLGLARARR